MEIFNTTLTQMLSMFTLILAGFIIKKLNVLPDRSDKAISKIVTCIFVPALAMHNQIINCTVTNFLNNSSLMLYGLMIIGIAVIIAYPVSKLFVPNYRESPQAEYQRQIYKYAFVFGNFGYMGNFIILGVWGDMMFFKYSMFTFLVMAITYIWGIYVLIPKEHSASLASNIKKGLTNPPFLGLVIGMILGITGLGAKLPQFVLTALDGAGNCMGPVAMLLAGIVIGGFNVKELLTNKKVYIITLFRLIIIPAVFVCALKLFGISKEIQLFALILLATPLGINTIIYPAAYDGDTKTGASMAMISHVLSVITIPLMYLLFIEIF